MNEPLKWFIDIGAARHTPLKQGVKFKRSAQGQKIRLEELNKHFHSSLVVSAATVEAAGEAPADLVGPLSVEVRGRHAPLDVYYLPTP